jgi:hypothetical protein
MDERSIEPGRSIGKQRGSSEHPARELALV